MALALLRWSLCIFIILVVSQMITSSLKSDYINSLQLKYGFSLSAQENSFLTLYNIAVKVCAYECQIRAECQAVNYGRLAKSCRLLGTNSSDLHRGQTSGTHIYLRKSDIIESSTLLRVSSICPTCNLNETCDVESGQCEIRECRTNTPENSTIRGNMLTFGSHIQITCNSWYERDNYASNCLPSGEWSDVAPCVYEFPCGIPPEFPNAVAIHYVYEGDERVVLYVCDFGYGAPLAFNNMTLKCYTNTEINSLVATSNGDSNSSYIWAEPEFMCIRDCRKPRTINGSSFSLGQNLENMTKTYTCLPGYVLNNTSTWNETLIMDTTCQSNGKWTDVNFGCLAVCGTPPEIANGLAVVVHTLDNRMFLEYECDEWYGTTKPNTVWNTSEVECLNGTWDEPFFNCLRDCYEPVDNNTNIANANATLQGGGTLMGDSREYTCAPGKAVNGTATMTCQPDGNWTTIDFQCVQECEVPTKIPNAESSQFANNGSVSSATYSCVAGYTFVTPDLLMATNSTFTLVCPQPGPWSLPNGTCLRDCFEPLEIENASLSIGETFEGTTRSYTCLPGFSVNNETLPSTTTCLSDGNWTSTEMQCIPVCGSPPVVTNGFAVAMATDIENRTYVDYVCDDGYATSQFYNVTAVECLNGTWQEPYFQCVRNCSSPPVIEDVTLSDGDTLEDTTRNYTCLPGFQAANGSQSMTRTTCQSDGSWTTMDLQCIPVCGTVPEAANGSWVGTTTDGNRTFLEFACDDGYTWAQFYNTTVVDCLNGTWEEPHFRCVRECEIPPVVPHAVLTKFVQYNSSLAGASYNCTQNYTKTVPGEPLVRVCRHLGTWGAPNQQCLRDCYFPSNVTNAMVTAGDTLEGTTRKYTCNPGFKVNGSEPTSTKCQPNGDWTSVEFQCIQACPQNWIFYGHTCFYHPGNSTIDVTDSLTYCSTIHPGSYMVQLENITKEELVIAFLKSHELDPVCIGLYDEFANGTWVWYGTGATMTYSNFAPAEPNPNEKHARLTYPSGVWEWRGTINIQCIPLCELE